MKMEDGLMRQIALDLGLDVRRPKGQTFPVKKCWHFYTDGESVDALFLDEADFKFGMNLIYLLIQSYNVVALSFSLMDTHFHFVLYGEFDECNDMMRDYIKRLSMYHNRRFSSIKKLKEISLEYQIIDNDWYLKNAICYVIKNATAAGLHFISFDYPWSSGALYFRSFNYWTAPSWAARTQVISLEGRAFRDFFRTRSQDIKEIKDVQIIDGLVFPGEYVAWNIVERVFVTPKSFYYFLGKSNEIDTEPKSAMSVPIQELRQSRTELTQSLFKVSSIRMLSIEQRIVLARKLKSQYYSSPKQIAKVCGLVYDDVKGLLQ